MLKKKERAHLLDAAMRINDMIDGALRAGDKKLARQLGHEATAVMLAVCIIDKANLVEKNVAKKR